MSERVQTASGEAGWDLLLFSDMHLGADLKREELRRAGSFDVLARREALDLELGGLLDHYAPGPGDGRRWRLVLAGDVFDFIGINLTPADFGEAPAFTTSADEERYGLEPGPERCVWMTELVLRRHPRFFERLAAFVARGHDVVIVRGNHDAALFWPGVQASLLKGLADAARRAGADLSLADLAENVRFEDWFYHEPGRIYVEHGHLHDELCADPGSRQVRHDRPNRLTQPVSALMLRHFANRFPSLDLDNVDRWAASDFIRWAIVVENPLRILAAFVQTVVVLLLPFVRRALRRQRQNRIRPGLGESAVVPAPEEEFAPEAALASRAQARLHQGLHGAETLALGLARLALRTGRVGALRILRVFHLDRAAAVGGGLAVSAGFGFTDASPGAKLLAISLALGSAIFVERYCAATRQVAIGPKLRAAAEEVSRLADVPLVVMGHSHKAVDTMLADQRTRYVNLGSWLGATRPDAVAAGFPHLVVRGATADFLRWHRPPAA